MLLFHLGAHFATRLLNGAGDAGRWAARQQATRSLSSIESGSKMRRDSVL